MKVEVKGVSNVVSKLNKIQMATNKIPLTLIRNIVQKGTALLRGKAPVWTGTFASRIRGTYTHSPMITIDYDLPYARRVLQGTKKTGGPFSPKGYHLFERNVAGVEMIASQEVSRWERENLN